MQSAISLIREPTCDILIKRDLRPVLSDEAQQLLALWLQVPPVAAPHQAKEGFVGPLQCLDIAPGDCLLHWAQAGCAVISMLCIALHGCACNSAILHTPFQTQSSILICKGQEGVGGESWRSHLALRGLLHL